jgi:Thiol:disulfide interchange protein DsbD, N-terminal/AhpC/TSA family
VAFAEKSGITYPLLSDEGSKLIAALGLLNTRVPEQHAVYGVQPSPRHQGIAYPGSFILDEQGVVTEKRFYQSYRERETGAGILRDAFDVETELHGPVAAFDAEGVSIHAWLDSERYRYFQRLYLTVRLDVAPGLHIYSAPIPDGFIPLSVEVAPLEGLEVGPPELPQPRPFHLAGLDEQFFVYTGTVTLRRPVTFTRRDAGDLVLQVSVRFQACSDTDCLMPASASLELPVAAEPLVPSAFSS